MAQSFHLILLGAFLATAFSAFHVFADEPATNASPANAGSAADWFEQASRHFGEGKLELAAREATSALEIDPKNVSAYELRGTIYLKEKLWDRAERDYTTLNQISPDPAYRYKLGEIRFQQKDYGDARPRFAALRSDERLGDLATYKVFLCDLLGGHEPIAARELGTLDSASRKPSFFYCHAVWDLYYDQRAAANQLFGQANHLFSSTINELYVGSLVETQRFRPPAATFTAKDGQSFVQSRVFLESDGLRASTPRGWITLPLDQLPDDLSGFPQDLREQIVHRRDAVTAPSLQVRPISLTTTAGKTYAQVRWTLEDAGLEVLTAGGWISIPFDELPADLSSFPQNLQDGIAARRKTAAESLPQIVVISFTTRTGKRYDEVRAALTDDGVLILTPEGWITVPFPDLSSDLSGFPENWRPRLQAESHSPEDNSPGMKAVSFTSTRGKRFDEVRAAMGDEGLRLLTPDGWIVLPYNQLPANLSPFPESWREKLASKQKKAPKTTSARN